MKQKLKNSLKWLKENAFHLFICICALIVAISALCSFIGETRASKNEQVTTCLEIDRPILRAIPNVDAVETTAPNYFVIPVGNNSGMPLSFCDNKVLYDIVSPRGSNLGQIKTSSLSNNTFRLQLWLPSVFGTNYQDIALYTYSSPNFNVNNVIMLVFNDDISLVKNTNGSTARPYLTLSNLSDSYSNTKYVTPISIWSFGMAKQIDNTDFYNGQQSVINSPQSYGLYTKEYVEQVKLNQIDLIRKSPTDYGLRTQADYDAYGQSQYQLGISESNDYSFQTMFIAIMSAPYHIIADGFNFEIFGLNIKDLVIFLLSVGIVIWCISIFRSKK